MTIDFMRKVDFWAGIPLTWALTFYVKVRGFLEKRPSIKNCKRVLFIELSEMGSAILADPALRRVKMRHEIFFVIFKKNAPSLKIFNTVEDSQIFTIRDGSFFTLIWDVLRFLAWTRSNKIQGIIDLELFSRFTAALSALSGARIRIGFYNPRSEGLYRGNLLTHPVSYNPHIHIAKNMIALTEPLIAGQESGDPLIRREIGDDEVLLANVDPPPEALERVKVILSQRVKLNHDHKVFLVNVNAGDFLPQRKWPKASFRGFVELLLDNHQDVVVLLTGSGAERAAVDEVAQHFSENPRCFNIAGDLRFEDLPALYRLSYGLLTNDSGPGHFASAIGLRTFVLFGPETPALYGPLRNATSIYAGLACSPCVSATNHRNTPCQDNQCLKVIPPQFVYAQVNEFLLQKTKKICAPVMNYSLELH